MLEPVWVHFPHLGLLELCQLKYIITCIVILLLGSSKIYTICNHSFEGHQAFPVLHCCRFHMVSVGQHSVKVDPTNRFVCPTSAPSNVTAGITLPAALCQMCNTMFSLMRDPVSWCHWDVTCYPVIDALLWLLPGCPLLFCIIYIDMQHYKPIFHQ